MGEDVLPNLASSGTLYSFKTRSYWTLLKSAGYEICFSENYVVLIEEVVCDFQGLGQEAET